VKRKAKTDAERARAYRLRHNMIKSVRRSVLKELYQEIERRKGRIAAAGGKPIDQLLRVLELMSFVERSLATLSGPAPALCVRAADANITTGSKSCP
jgi:hypothetical protein